MGVCLQRRPDARVVLGCLLRTRVAAGQDRRPLGASRRGNPGGIPLGHVAVARATAHGARWYTHAMVVSYVCDVLVWSGAIVLRSTFGARCTHMLTSRHRCCEGAAGGGARTLDTARRAVFQTPRGDGAVLTCIRWCAVRHVLPGGVLFPEDLSRVRCTLLTLPASPLSQAWVVVVALYLLASTLYHTTLQQCQSAPWAVSLIGLLVTTAGVVTQQLHALCTRHAPAPAPNVAHLQEDPNTRDTRHYNGYGAVTSSHAGTYHGSVGTPDSGADVVYAPTSTPGHAPYLGSTSFGDYLLMKNEDYDTAQVLLDADRVSSTHDGVFSASMYFDHEPSGINLVDKTRDERSLYGHVNSSDPLGTG